MPISTPTPPNNHRPPLSTPLLQAPTAACASACTKWPPTKNPRRRSTATCAEQASCGEGGRERKRKTPRRREGKRETVSGREREAVAVRRGLRNCLGMRNFRTRPAAGGAPGRGLRPRPAWGAGWWASRLAHVGVDSCNCSRKRAAPLVDPHAALVARALVTQTPRGSHSAPSVINDPQRFPRTAPRKVASNGNETRRGAPACLINWPISVTRRIDHQRFQTSLTKLIVRLIVPALCWSGAPVQQHPLHRRRHILKLPSHLTRRRSPQLALPALAHYWFSGACHVVCLSTSGTSPQPWQTRPFFHFAAKHHTLNWVLRVFFLPFRSFNSCFMSVISIKICPWIIVFI